jgi:hypothetical protein
MDGLMIAAGFAVFANGFNQVLDHAAPVRCVRLTTAHSRRNLARPNSANVGTTQIIIHPAVVLLIASVRLREAAAQGRNNKNSRNET